MKKITFLLVGAALALAACSKTETVNEQSVDAIGFNGAYIGNPTDSRAVTELDNSITSFQVYGQYTKDAAAAVQVFDNVEVSNTTGSWTYTGGLRPWIEGAAYVFAGYAPSNVTAPAVNAGGYLSWANYDVSANQYDLIYATQQATGQTYGNNQQVVFTFNHLLSIVGFTFKSGFDADYVKNTGENFSGGFLSVLSGRAFGPKYSGDIRSFSCPSAGHGIIDSADHSSTVNIVGPDFLIVMMF